MTRDFWQLNLFFVLSLTLVACQNDQQWQKNFDELSSSEASSIQSQYDLNANQVIEGLKTLSNLEVFQASETTNLKRDFGPILNSALGWAASESDGMAAISKFNSQPSPIPLRLKISDQMEERLKIYGKDWILKIVKEDVEDLKTNLWIESIF